MYLVVSDDWTSDCYFKKREYSSIVLIQKKKKRKANIILYIWYIQVKNTFFMYRGNIKEILGSLIYKDDMFSLFC